MLNWVIMWKVEQKTEHYVRTTKYYLAVDGQLEAWHYTPQKPGAHEGTVVLLAGGLGAQKDMGLESFCAAYAERGTKTYFPHCQC